MKFALRRVAQEMQRKREHKRAQEMQENGGNMQQVQQTGLSCTLRKSLQYLYPGSAIVIYIR